MLSGEPLPQSAEDRANGEAEASAGRGKTEAAACRPPLETLRRRVIAVSPERKSR